MPLSASTDGNTTKQTTASSGSTRATVKRLSSHSSGWWLMTTPYGNKINSQGQLNISDVNSMKHSWAVGRVQGASKDLDFN
ncbi:hypothetical protein FRC01_007388 [Tulasnella sp. 417]|nr:hypothetical protein FRC01_007388 [Tulasnella sp. 417]